MKAVGYIVIGVIAALAVARKDKAEATKTHAEAEAIKSDTQNERDRMTIESLGVVIERLEQSYNTLSDRAAEDWRDLNARIEKMENERRAWIWLPAGGPAIYPEWRQTYSDHFPISVAITVSADDDVD